MVATALEEDILVVDARTGPWYHVTGVDGASGWVHRDLVRNDVDRDYEADNNALMATAASNNANVHLLYWDGLSGQCIGDCIYQDGIHLKSTGAAYYVLLIDTVLGDS